MAIDGAWYNELGSLLTITSTSGSTINGTYETGVGTATGATYNLTGYIDTGNVDSGANPAVGWVVLWDGKNSLTAWAGQYFNSDGVEVIIAMWLLRSEGTEGQNWQSTLVGEDIFFRTIELAMSPGLPVNLRQPAHPVS